jgi:hypothetical protein
VTELSHLAGPPLTQHLPQRVAVLLEVEVPQLLRPSRLLRLPLGCQLARSLRQVGTPLLWSYLPPARWPQFLYYPYGHTGPSVLRMKEKARARWLILQDWNFWSELGEKGRI